MAIRYSNQYGTAPNAPGLTPIYRGPAVEGEARERTVYVEVPVANNVGDGDSIALLTFNAAAKVTRLHLGVSADLDTNNDFTFNLGTDASGQGSLFASASTALQGTAGLDVTAQTLLAAAPCAAGATLQLTRVAGALEGTGTLRALVSFIPA